MRRLQGFTMVELLVTLTIVSALIGSFLLSLTGMRTRDNIDRAVTLIVGDVVSIRSRAVSSGQTHRIRFLSNASWIVERFDTAATPNAWVATSDTRYLPNQTSLMEGSLTNAGLNLEATPRGVFVFQNGATGTPYVSVEATGESKTKSIIVATGGAVEVIVN